MIAAGGKQTVDTPKHLFSTNVAWNPGRYEVQIAANYVGERFYTYANDAEVPSYWLINAAARTPSAISVSLAICA